MAWIPGYREERGREQWDRVSWRLCNTTQHAPSQNMQNSPPLSGGLDTQSALISQSLDTKYGTEEEEQIQDAAACFDTKQMISPWCLQQMIIHNPCVSIIIIGLNFKLFRKYKSKVRDRLWSTSHTQLLNIDRVQTIDKRMGIEDSWDGLVGRGQW